MPVAVEAVRGWSMRLTCHDLTCRAITAPRTTPRSCSCCFFYHFWWRLFRRKQPFRDRGGTEMVSSSATYMPPFLASCPNRSSCVPYHGRFFFCLGFLYCLGGVFPGENVPAAVEAVLRWSWTITGGRRLAHVVRRPSPVPSCVG